MDFLIENFWFACFVQTLCPQVDETDDTQIFKR